MSEISPQPTLSDQHYIVRRGQFKGRNLHDLTADELGTMISNITKDADAAAGIKMMRWILHNHGPKSLIDFVAWGQNIIDETGNITRADFVPDEGDPPSTQDEKQMLRAARPNVFNRRNLLLGVPSALIAGFTISRHSLKGLEALLEKSKPEDKNDPKNEKTLARINKRLEKFSSTPIVIVGVLTLLYEVVEMIKDYDDEKFEQIQNAVAEISDTMGISEPTPTFRLPNKRAEHRAQLVSKLTNSTAPSAFR